MIASFLVETEKMLRRPASWVLSGILAVSTLLFIYVLGYLLSSALGGEGAELLRDLEPASVPASAMSQITSLGVPVALVLGVLAMGGEFQWGTVTSSVTNPPGRVGFIMGKLSALCVLSALLAAIPLVVGLLLSLISASLLDLSAWMPSVAALAEALWASWLILLVYAALGFFLTVVLRSSGIAIAVSLVYVLVLEPVAGGVLNSAQNARQVAAVLPGQAVNALGAAVDGPSAALSTTSLSDAAFATAVLILWTAFLGLVSLLVFTRRDIR